MRRALRNLLLLVCAGAAGWGAGDLLYHSKWSRDAIGRVFGRGRFLALAGGRAIHEHDLFKGGDARPETILVAEALRRSARNRQFLADKAEREMNLLRAQFGDEESFEEALASARLTETSLRSMVEDHLEVRHWIEEQVEPGLQANESECRQAYEENRACFQLPPRFRASHLFITAPEGTAPDVVLKKQNLAQGLSMRLLTGESLEDLAAEASEDEATKGQGGDLGYFSAWRMPPDFMAEVEKLTMGETSSPVRCHLGFHIVALAEVKPARELGFAEARAEIAAQVVNRKRVAAVASIAERVRRPEWAPDSLPRP